jgi:hypothetical protein
MTILRELEIEEISAVDTPAQKPALALFTKNEVSSMRKQEPVTTQTPPMPPMPAAEAVVPDTSEDQLQIIISKLNDLEERITKLETPPPEEENKSEDMLEEQKQDPMAAGMYKSRIAELIRSRDAAVAKARYLELSKRAEEFRHLPGTEKEVVAVIQALDTIKDNQVRENAYRILKSQANGAAFKSSGARDASGEDNDAETILSGLAKRAAKDKGVSYQTAYNELLKTEQGSRLYNEIIGA